MITTFLAKMPKQSSGLRRWSLLQSLASTLLLLLVGASHQSMILRTTAFSSVTFTSRRKCRSPVASRSLLWGNLDPPQQEQQQHSSVFIPNSSSGNLFRSFQSGFLPQLLFSIPILLLPFSSSALDMDAFASQQLTPSSASSSKDMSADEALCRFGQPSPLVAEACQRVGMTKKSKIPASGQIDRGDFIRCKAAYVENKQTHKLEKEWRCQ